MSSSLPAARRAANTEPAVTADWRQRWAANHAQAINRFARHICPGWADWQVFHAAVWQAAMTGPAECYQHGHHGFSALTMLPNELPARLESHIKAVVSAVAVRCGFRPPRKARRTAVLAVACY